MHIINFIVCNLFFISTPNHPALTSSTSKPISIHNISIHTTQMKDKAKWSESSVIQATQHIIRLRVYFIRETTTSTANFVTQYGNFFHFQAALIYEAILANRDFPFFFTFLFFPFSLLHIRIYVTQLKRLAEAHKFPQIFWYTHTQHSSFIFSKNMYLRILHTRHPFH